MTDCPTALALQNFLADQANLPVLQKIARFNTIDEVRASLKDHGIDLDQCDYNQALRVVHNYLTEITEDDLLQVQGGEKIASKIVVGAAAAAVVVGTGAVIAGFGTATPPN